MKNNKKINFKNFFIISSVIWIVISVLSMFETRNEPEPLTISELIIGDAFIIFIWFIILYIIFGIVSIFNKHKNKENEIGQKENKKVIDNVSNEKGESKITKIENYKNKDILYTCNSIVDAYEFKLMIPYFKEIYWTYVLKGLIINIILCIIYTIISGKSLIDSWSMFTILQIIFMIYYKVNLGNVIEKDFNLLQKKENRDINYIIDFYRDYLVRKNDTVSQKFYYRDIIRCIETDTNFYLKTNIEKKVIVIQKNECELELVNFIRDNFKDIEKNLGTSSRLKQIKQCHHPDFIRKGMIILFIITIASLWGALYSLLLIGKVIPQHGFNFTKNTWVFWCWLPIPIISVMLGFKYKKMGIKCTKNIVGGFIIGLLLLIYGSFCMLPTFSQDYSKIDTYRDIINAKIPENGDLEIQEWNTYFDADKTEYVLINAYYDREDVQELVKSIENNETWILSTNLKSELKIFIPSDLYLDSDSYFSIYNKTINQYNIVPEKDGDYEIYVMKYDKSDKKLEIHKFKYNYKK